MHAPRAFMEQHILLILDSVLYGNEACSVTYNEENWPRMFENRVAGGNIWTSQQGDGKITILEPQKYCGDQSKDGEMPGQNHALVMWETHNKRIMRNRIISF